MHHQLFGLFIDEWASLFAIGAGIGGVLTVVMKYVLYPLQTSIDRLNSTIKRLTDNTEKHSQRLDKLEDDFENHIGEAKVRNQRIKALEKEVFK